MLEVDGLDGSFRPPAHTSSQGTSSRASELFDLMQHASAPQSGTSGDVTTPPNEELLAPPAAAAPRRRKRSASGASGGASEEGGGAGRPRNKWGLRGIRHDSNKKRRPWEAKMSVTGKDRSLGYYRTSELAAKAYDLATLRMRGAGAIDKLNLPQDAMVLAAVQLVLAGRNSEVAVPASAQHALEVGNVSPIIIDDQFDADGAAEDAADAGAHEKAPARQRRPQPRTGAHAGAKRDRGSSSLTEEAAVSDVLVYPPSKSLAAIVGAGSTATSLWGRQLHPSYATEARAAGSVPLHKHPRMSVTDAAHALIGVSSNAPVGDSMAGAAARASAPFSMFAPAYKNASNVSTALLSPLTQHATSTEMPSSSTVSSSAASSTAAAAVAGAAAAALAMAASMPAGTGRAYAPYGSTFMDAPTTGPSTSTFPRAAPQFHAGFALVGLQAHAARAQL